MQTRPTSLLQRGKSFTAEDFNAALTLSSSPPSSSSDQMQVEVENESPDEDDLFMDDGKNKAGHMHHESFDSTTTVDSEMDGPATPEAAPGIGITLTTPSPSRNRAQQMKEMGSPTPGAGAGTDGGAFGEMLTMAVPVSKFTRPTPMNRSRSTTDGGYHGPSAVSQFMLGGASAVHQRSYTEGDSTAMPCPNPKRQRLDLELAIPGLMGGGLGMGMEMGVEQALKSPFDENKRF